MNEGGVLNEELRMNNGILLEVYESVVLFIDAVRSTIHCFSKNSF